MACKTCGEKAAAAAARMQSRSPAHKARLMRARQRGVEVRRARNRDSERREEKPESDSPAGDGDKE